MSVAGRRVLAVFGGAVFGLASGAASPWTGAGADLAGEGLVAGLGLGLMVAALVRE